jgi:hypothetical protein
MSLGAMYGGVSKVNFVADELTVYNFSCPRLPKADLYSMQIGLKQLLLGNDVAIRNFL